jgi:hypothetical protein
LEWVRVKVPEQKCRSKGAGAKVSEQVFVKWNSLAYFLGVSFSSDSFCGGEPFLRMRNEGEERGRKIWGFFLVGISKPDSNFFCWESGGFSCVGLILSMDEIW